MAATLEHGTTLKNHDYQVCKACIGDASVSFGDTSVCSECHCVVTRPSSDISRHV